MVIHDSRWDLLSRHSLFVGPYYTYGVAPPYSVFGEYRGLCMSTFVSGRLLTSFVSPLTCGAIYDTFVIASLQDSYPFPLARVC